MLLVLMAPFNAMLLGLGSMAYRALRIRWFKPPAGGVQIVVDRFGTRARVPESSPFGWAMLAVGVAGLLLILAAVLLRNQELSVGTVCLAAVTVYGSGVVVYFWQWRINNSGIRDLVINEVSRTVELPLTFKRKERVRASLKDIESVTVTKVKRPGTKGRMSYNYLTVLQLRGVGAETIADWPDESRAIEFAQWLRQKIGLRDAASSAL